MQDLGGVRLDLEGIELDLEKYGHDQVHVEFMPDVPGGTRAGGDGAALIAATEDAIVAANGTGRGETMWGQNAVLTLGGTSLKLKDYWGPEALANWLSVFCRTLGEQGHTGVVRPTPLDRPPSWLYFSREVRATAYVALDEHLSVPSAADLWCNRAVAWAARSGGEAHLATGASLQRDPSPDVAAHLAASLRVARHWAGLEYINEPSGRAARAYTARDGMAVYQARGLTDPWPDLIARARDAIIYEADRTRLAFIAMVPVQALQWDDRGRDLPSLPTVDPAALKRNTPVWRRHVPDAHGIQLLTREHIDMAHDLSEWQNTEVHPGRYLVEARDPAAWFAPGGPSATVVEQARSDFGDLIVSPNALD